MQKISLLVVLAILFLGMNAQPSEAQRGEQEGQTFTKKVDQSVLPDFLTVVDDPTIRKINGMDLGGWYEYDDEGMPATRVEVIKNGILKSFLKIGRAASQDCQKI